MASSKGPTPAFTLTCGIAFRAQLVAYPASRNGDSILVNVCDTCAPANKPARLGEQKYCKTCAKIVDKALKAYELPTGGYVLLSEQEVKTAMGEKSKELSVEAVLDWASIDPVVIERSTFIGPADQISVEPFELIRQVLVQEKWCLLVKYVGRTGRDKYGVVRNHADSGTLMLEELFFPDEVRDFQSQNKANVEPAPALSKAALAMGKELLSSYKTTFAMAFPALKDSYNDRVEELVKFRQANPTTAVPVTPSAPVQQVSSLEAALQASLAARGTKRLVTIDDGDVRKPPIKAEEKKDQKAAPKRRKSA